ncbi:MAG TPA: hypothetical protein VN793_07715, partial [Acidimicrobiales bacterium]|nr:hypothetical protein [Acidimicrobiales bacterium]
RPVTGEGRPVTPDPHTRPAIGAVRRQRAEQTARSEGAGAPPAQAAAPPDVPPRPPDGAPRPPDVAPSGPLPDRDTLVEAWGDHLLRSLPARAKALYSSGRFTSVEGSIAVFALPNSGYLRRCEEVRPLVELALTTHFGVGLSLRLVVDEPGGSAPFTGEASAGAEARDREATDLGDDDFDPEDPGEPLEVESLVHSRLLEAFPGAKEVPN